MSALSTDRPEACPFLPDLGGQRFPASSLGAFRQGPRGAEFYRLALCCAQSRWLEGLPAQALLMLNRAFGARLDADADAALLEDHPIPYRAVGWVLRHGETTGFLGNPRRHFQHLATRMSGHETELRTTRAWACWELAKAVNPAWPADHEQLEKESLAEPTRAEVAERLAAQALPGEYDEWLLALDEV